MLCYACKVERRTVICADQVVCSECSTVLQAAKGAGAVVPRTFTKERPTTKTRKAVLKAVKRIGIPSSSLREAAQKAAHAAVEGVSASGKLKPGEAKAIAEKAVKARAYLFF